ncbi:hypothetical protein K8I85_01750 [bacterium]|nr:hypothetical protein [bacterium]
MANEHLGAVAPTELVEARIALHWAAQLAAVVGNHLVPARPDDSHSNLEWLADHGALAGEWTPSGVRLRSALRVSDLTQLVLDESGTELDSFALRDHTLAQGLDRMNGAVARALGRAGASPLALREYDGMPSHAVASAGGTFDIPARHLAELARWYASADGKLRALASGRSDASPVRCWPHHFDIATLLTLEGSGEAAKTIGVGMAPGDGSYAEPYWYVNAWPFPAGAALPELDGHGRWHTAGWNGAVLTGSELVAAGDGAAQAARLDAFLASAIAASEGILAKG